MGAGRFGAPRSGHTHQGQDTMAACGTPLVAARGGTVQFAGFEAAAGNYIVIDGKGTGFDFMYAHLEEPSPLHTGESVRTGQPIGVVGETGDATACHLHFEIWTAPGWYEGGSPIDPLPYLEKWDRYS
jgi:murein DD-endopeptidase MepM/ murein hydrolase activator NlpD